MGPPVAVVTGSNTGLGYEIVRALSSSMISILCCRDAIKGNKARDKLMEEDSSRKILVKVLDITIESSVDAFIGDLSREYPQGIQVVVNNAAIAFKNVCPTPFKDQLDPTFATNFWSTINFTNKVVPLIRSTDSFYGRLVFMASRAGTMSLVKHSDELKKRWLNAQLDMDGIKVLANEYRSSVENGTHEADGWPASNYGMTKLCIIASAKHYGRELAGNVKVTSMCPGWCATNMGGPQGERSPETGAKTVIYLCTTQDDVKAGGFYVEDNKEYSGEY